MYDIEITISKSVFGLFDYKKTYKRQIPQNWEDIPMSDRAAHVRFQLLAKPPFSTLLTLKKVLKLPKSAFLSLDASENFAAVVDMMDWLEVPQIPKPLIQSFRHKGTTYLLPKADFDKCTAYEFAYADTMYREYKENPDDDEPLRLLVACLCRPRKIHETDIINTGDERQAIVSESEIEHRANALKLLPIETAVIVLKYFEGVEQRVFDALAGAGIVSRNPSVKSENTDTNSPFWKTYRQLAKGLNKTEEQVQAMSFWSVLAILIEEHEEQERQNAQLEKIKNQYT